MHSKVLLDSSVCGKWGNNIITGNTSYVSSRFYTEGSGKISIGYSSLENCGILAEDGAEVSIGDLCKFKDCYIICRKNSKVSIGDNVEVHGEMLGRTVIHSKDGKEISIGDDCLLSGNIIIRNNDGIRIVFGDDITDNISRSIVIGEKVWICEGVHILKGVHIGDVSVVGAGSVVTGHDAFADGHVIIGGNPAKVIRHLSIGDCWKR